MRPKLRDARELAAAPVAGQATPDPTTPEFERAKALKFQRAYPEARAALEAFLTRYPDSTHRDEAEAIARRDQRIQNCSPRTLDRARSNTSSSAVMCSTASPNKTKSDPELIFQANGLDRIMLQIGQKLQIPQVDFSIEVHLNTKRLVLLNHGQVFQIVRASGCPAIRVKR